MQIVKSAEFALEYVCVERPFQYVVIVSNPNLANVDLTSFLSVECKTMKILVF
jgi:hypothetical protein